MPYLPVNTNIVVEIGPCIDDSDFKTFESGIAYDAPGMNIDLLKKDSNGLTKVDITPTSGGINDWIIKGNGVYELEISAGQNDTQGTLRIVGICNGVLPFESPVYTVVSESYYSKLGGSDISVIINHNYGGADVLAYKTGGNVGIDDATIRAYLKSDYDAGNIGSAYVKATTMTDVNGRWIYPMNLDPAVYILYYFKQGAYGPDTQEVTVS